MMRSRRGAAAACAALTALTVVVGCGTATEPEKAGGSAAAQLLAPDRFAAAVAEPDRLTVNVHVPFEGDIPGTDVSVPYDRLRQLEERLPRPGTPLAIYCRSGAMSAEAAPVFADLGYDDVVELRGGMKAWAAAGRHLRG